MFDFGLLERPALNFVEADGVDQILRAQHPKQLAHVQFGHQHCLVALDHVAEIRRQRIEMAQMHVPDLAALCALRVQRRGNGTVRRAPGDNQQIAFRIAGGNDVGNVLHDGRNFCGADAHHVLVIQRLVVDVAGDVLLFEAADAMLEARCAGNGPGPRKSLRIALVRQISRSDSCFGRKFHGEVRNFINVRNLPGLGAVGKVAVGKNNHRNHVLDGDAAGFERGPEAIAGSRSGDDRNRRFRVASEQRLQQIGLLGFRRQAGGRTAALNVANHQRNFDGDGETQRFRLQRHAGAGSRGDRQRAGVGRADRGGDGGDFIFGLKRHYAEVFVLRRVREECLTPA